jgi:hypothetical protein
VESLGGDITLEDPQPWTTTGATVRLEIPAAVVTGWQTSLVPSEKETVT